MNRRVQFGHQVPHPAAPPRMLAQPVREQHTVNPLKHDPRALIHADDLIHARHGQARVKQPLSDLHLTDDRRCINPGIKQFDDASRIPGKNFGGASHTQAFAQHNNRFLFSKDNGRSIAQRCWLCRVRHSNEPATKQQEPGCCQSSGFW